nr:carboxymuconolactone decarboxylase family protein [Fodinicola feengrottensis]
MERRMTNLPKLAAGAFKAMYQLEAYLAQSRVPHSTLELVKLRASQINGCGFCVDMHSHDAKKAGGDRRTAIRGRRLARHAFLHRPRTRRAGPDRSRHPAA